MTATNVWAVPVVAVISWIATLAVVLMSSHEEIPGWDFIAALLYLPAGFLCAWAFTTVSTRALGAERLFWGLLGAGVLFYLAGSPLWSPVRGAGSAVTVFSYVVSNVLLFSALLQVLSRVSRRARYVAWLDALCVMFSVTVLLSYFLATPAEFTANIGRWQEAAAVFFGPVLGAGLLYLALVLLGVDEKPPFAGPLAGGFLLLLVAEGSYLFATHHSIISGSGLTEPALWQQLLWVAGPVLVALAARNSCPAAFEGSPWELGVAPGKHASFWFGPLSPATHFAVLFAFAAFHPPVPSYLLLAGAILVLYFALRISVFLYAVHRLRLQRDTAVGRLEQERISEELHDTLKQNVYGAALLLDSYKETKKQGDDADAEHLLNGAMAACREASHQVGRSIEEMRARCARSLDLTALLRERLAETREHFGVRTHEDLEAGLTVLTPEEQAAAYRIVSEALWNAGKHSGAKNVYLESREVGSVFLLRVRDDGRGLPPEECQAGMGFLLMRGRAEEVGAALDVISAPEKGTTIQARFEKR